MTINVIREDIRAMSAYPVPTLDDNAIKLDAMEVPYLLPENLRQELAQQLTNAPINRYPNPAQSGLAEQLRATFAMPAEAKIALGNGSDELIQLITQLVAKSDAVVLGLEPSFVMYRHNAQLFGMRYVGVPLNADFTLNTEAVLHAITEHQPVLIFLAYPNNPTGVAFERAEIERIIQAATGLVVIDEAYGAFAPDSFLSQAGQPEHLIVLRTLSKIGFAGLRLGYAVGSAAVINELAKIVPPYNMNQLSLLAGKFALQHMDAVNQNIDILKTERSRLAESLAALPETQVFDSQANFITVRLPQAAQAYDSLKKQNIWVKKLDGGHELLHDTLRLTVGTPEQNDQVINGLRNHLDEIERAKQATLQPATSGKSNIGWIVLIVAIVAALILFVVFSQKTI